VGSLAPGTGLAKSTTSSQAQQTLRSMRLLLHDDHTYRFRVLTSHFFRG